MHTTFDPVREEALKILCHSDTHGSYSNIVLGKRLEEGGFNDTDKAFITGLVYGTVSWRLNLDWVIGRFSKLKPARISPWIMNILRMGAYQILHTDRIPVPAACDESVKLALKYGHKGSAGFVNAMLRNIAGFRDSAVWPDMAVNPVESLSVRYSHPAWLVKRWVGRYGTEFTEDLLNCNNAVPDFTVRINTLKTDREYAVRRLSEEGMKVSGGRFADDSLTITEPGRLFSSGSFSSGLVSVQDESSMLVSRILDPKPGDTVMDVCSAPGGKTCHIAALMQNRGRLLASDISESKLKLVEEAAARMGAGIVETAAADASIPISGLAGKADRVLVDAPCSGLGIIRKKPDIKWSRSEKDIRELSELQYSIINASAGYVKPGGVLVYSTCTTEPEENRMVVDRFLDSHRDFEPDDITPMLKAYGFCKLDGRLHGSMRGSIQLYPNIDHADGFFIARLVRRQS